MRHRLVLRVGLALVTLALLVGGPGVGAQEAPVPAAAEREREAQATLEVEVEPATVTIGDRFEARLTLRTSEAPTAPPRFPVWEEHWGDAEILDVAAPRDEGGGIWSQRLTLALFDTGPATLPAVSVEVPSAEATTRATSAPTIVRVDSVLPATDEEIAPQPPEAPRALPVGRRFWIALAVLGLAALTLGYLALRTARRIHQALAALAMSPLEAFQGALARLREENDAQRLYAELSLELRRYLGRSLCFPAAEGTTTQIQRALRDRQLPAPLVRGTLDLLREADQIKFARGAADPTAAGRRLADAERLAAGVEDWLAPAAAENGEEAA